MFLAKINREKERHPKCSWNLEALSTTGVFTFVFAVGKELHWTMEVFRTEQHQSLIELL